MKNDEGRVYYRGGYTYEEMLREMEIAYDFEFKYKGKRYNITETFSTKHKPCIVRCYEHSNKEEAIMYCDTFEELLNTYRFEDGVLLLDALKSDDISSY